VTNFLWVIFCAHGVLGGRGYSIRVDSLGSLYAHDITAGSFDHTSQQSARTQQELVCLFLPLLKYLTTYSHSTSRYYPYT
jgi:hypothetical protein